MRLEYRIPLIVTRYETDEVVVPSDALNGRQASDLELADYLDFDLVELGICGGYSSVIVEGEEAELSVWFGSPEPIDAATAARMLEYVRVQMIDGAGEGGFDLEIDGDHLVAHPLEDAEIQFSQFDDGLVVPPANRVALAAKNGDAEAVRAGLARDPEDANRPLMGIPPLDWALSGMNESAVTALLNAGADPNRSSSWGSPPIVSCILNTTLDDATTARLLTLLLDAGANPAMEYSGKFPADWARDRKKPASSEILRLSQNASR